MSLSDDDRRLLNAVKVDVVVPERDPGVALTGDIVAIIEPDTPEMLPALVRALVDGGWDAAHTRGGVAVWRHCLRRPHAGSDAFSDRRALSEHIGRAGLRVTEIDR